MHPRRFALIGGILMLLMGIVALIPNFSQLPSDLPYLRVETSYGLFLGLFPLNIFNKIALIAFGIAGILASRPSSTTLPASIRFSRTVFVAMGLLAVLGMISQTNTLFGFWPLYGNEVWAHGLFAVFGGYFGFVLTSKAADELEAKHI